MSIQPRLSIITPIYNTTATLKAYLDAVIHSSFKDFELIIVDDGSHDDPLSVIGGYPVRYHRTSLQQGSFHARQQGVDICQGRIIVFIDADVLIADDTLEKIVAVFDARPEIAALICSYDDDPGAINMVSQYKFLYHHYVHQHEDEYVRSFWTGCGAVKKDVFIDMGGFKHSFLNGLDPIRDIEFGYKLTHHGFRIYNAKHVQVKHLKRLTFFSWIHTDIVNRGVPWIRILMVYKDFKSNLNISRASCLSVFMVWASLVLILSGLMMDKVLLLLAGAAFLFFMCLNQRMIAFFVMKKGLVFAGVSILLLWVYYFNCGLCVLWGAVSSVKHGKGSGVLH